MCFGNNTFLNQSQTSVSVGILYLPMSVYFLFFFHCKILPVSLGFLQQSCSFCCVLLPPAHHWQTMLSLHSNQGGATITSSTALRTAIWQPFPLKEYILQVELIANFQANLDTFKYLNSQLLVFNSNVDKISPLKQVVTPKYSYSTTVPINIDLSR